MRRSVAALAIVLVAAMLWHGTAARGLSGTVAVSGDANPERRLQEEEEAGLLPGAESEINDAAADEASGTDTDQKGEAADNPVADAAVAAQGAAWQTAAASDGAAEPGGAISGASEEETVPSGVEHVVADDELAERNKARQRCSVAGMPLPASKACCHVRRRFRHSFYHNPSVSCAWVQNPALITEDHVAALPHNSSCGVMRTCCTA